MPDRFARRFSARPRRAAVRRGGWLPPADSNVGPVAPPELRAEPPDTDGVRRGLVGFYRAMLAGDRLDTGGRFSAAEARLFERLGE